MNRNSARFCYSIGSKIVHNFRLMTLTLGRLNKSTIRVSVSKIEKLPSNELFSIQSDVQISPRHRFRSINIHTHHRHSERLHCCYSEENVCMETTETRKNRAKCHHRVVVSPALRSIIIFKFHFLYLYCYLQECTAFRRLYHTHASATDRHLVVTVIVSLTSLSFRPNSRTSSIKVSRVSLSDVSSMLSFSASSLKLSL